jgi:hypothetical protein
VYLLRGSNSLGPPQTYSLIAKRKNIFKLEEETTALLLLLPALIAEMPVFGSASGSGCRLVVGIPQDSSVFG